LAERGRILSGEARRHPGALAHAALLEVAGVDVDQVGAGRLDLLFDRRLRAAAERHHGDHRADPMIMPSIVRIVRIFCGSAP
jgi:hypothetical protein